MVKMTKSIKFGRHRLHQVMIHVCLRKYTAVEEAVTLRDGVWIEIGMTQILRSLGMISPAFKYGIKRVDSNAPHIVLKLTTHRSAKTIEQALGES